MTAPTRRQTNVPCMTITPRQANVLRILLEHGGTDHLIGERLGGISENTIGMHLRNIYKAARHAGAQINARDELMAALYHKRLAYRIEDNRGRNMQQ